MAKTVVVIPYAGEGRHRLAPTIESARTCHGQAGIVLERDRNRSLPSTMNRGARKAIELGATHIMWLSTGDTVRPQRLIMEPPMNRAQFCLTLLNGSHVYPDPEEHERKKLYEDNQFCLSGATIPVWAWEQVGGMNEGLRYCSDWDLALRLDQVCGWDMLEVCYVHAHEYPGGLTDQGKADPRRARDRAKVAKLARKLWRNVR